MPGTRKLGKPTDQRNAMLRQQVTDFLDNGRMETTLARAKEIAPLAEKMWQRRSSERSQQSTLSATAATPGSQLPEHAAETQQKRQLSSWSERNR